VRHGENAFEEKEPPCITKLTKKENKSALRESALISIISTTNNESSIFYIPIFQAEP
jgi:hypothetical protein